MVQAIDINLNIKSISMNLMNILVNNPAELETSQQWYGHDIILSTHKH